MTDYDVDSSQGVRKPDNPAPRARILIIVGLVIVVAAATFVALRLVAAENTKNKPSISLIKTYPGKYVGTIVTVGGEVTNRVSLVALKYYTLYDKGDEIYVITKRTLPVVGTKHKVRGKVQEFSILGWQGLVIVEL